MHRFVQYNVLCPNLASPAYYEKSPPEALNETTRKAKIVEKLESFTR
jgi:mRNA deadenylase 3'-5' endonuclease subunit Ccr4